MCNNLLLKLSFTGSKQEMATTLWNAKDVGTGARGLFRVTAGRIIGSVLFLACGTVENVTWHCG